MASRPRPAGAALNAPTAQSVSPVRLVVLPTYHTIRQAFRHRDPCVREERQAHLRTPSPKRRVIWRPRGEACSLRTVVREASCRWSRLDGLRSSPQRPPHDHVRAPITDHLAVREWTELSALRSGASIKSRRDVYTALRPEQTSRHSSTSTHGRSTAPRSRHGVRAFANPKAVRQLQPSLGRHY